MLCASKPEFGNVVPEGFRVENNTFCVICLVLVSLKLGLARSIGVKSANHTPVNILRISAGGIRAAKIVNTEPAGLLKYGTQFKQHSTQKNHENQLWS